MRNRYFIKLAMLLLISISSSVGLAAEDEQENVVPQPMEKLELAAMPEKDESGKDASVLAARVDRSWGLLLGDELSVKVDTSELEGGIDESSLPQPETRYGVWLYLKGIDVEGKQVVFNYQVVNVPKQNTSVETPTFDVKSQTDKWFIVSAVPLMVGPSLAVGEGISNITIQSDIAPTTIATDELISKLKRYSIIAVISWLALALWHFGWNTKHREPFAQAVHDLGRLRWKRSVADDEASRILHTAFNHTADTVVVYGEIDNLLERHAWLAPLQDDIKSFYQASEQHFFARQSGQEPDIDMIKKLAKACRAKEMLA